LAWRDVALRSLQNDVISITFLVAQGCLSAFAAFTAIVYQRWQRTSVIRKCKRKKMDKMRVHLNLTGQATP
jgi:hypothetical protein